MLDEKALRKPGFTEGERIKLGDGQEWTFPLPRLRFYPVRNPDGTIEAGGGRSYGPAYEDLLEELLQCEPEDTYRELSLRFRMTVLLLTQNYELADRDLRLLVAVDDAQPGCREMWDGINGVLHCSSRPKVSGDGSD